MFSSWQDQTKNQVMVIGEGPTDIGLIFSHVMYAPYSLSMPLTCGQNLQAHGEVIRGKYGGHTYPSCVARFKCKITKLANRSSEENVEIREFCFGTMWSFMGKITPKMNGNKQLKYESWLVFLHQVKQLRETWITVGWLVTWYVKNSFKSTRMLIIP